MIKQRMLAKALTKNFKPVNIIHGSAGGTNLKYNFRSVTYCHSANKKISDVKMCQSVTEINSANSANSVVGAITNNETQCNDLMKKIITLEKELKRRKSMVLLMACGITGWATLRWLFTSREDNSDYYKTKWY